MVESVGLYGGVLGTLWRLLSCIVGSVGLYDESVELYSGECWVTYGGVLSYMVWSVRLHGGMLGYMVGCWVTWWILFGSIMGSVGLHGGECWVISVGCWVTWWSVELHVGVLGYMVEC